MIYPYKKIFNEFTIEYWRKQISPLIKRTKAIRTKLKGQEVTVARFIGLKGKASNPILVFLTEPTYDFENFAIKNGNANSPKKENLYEVKIQLLDLNKWRTGKYLHKMNYDEFREILDVVEIKLDCECMAFHWTGPRYQLSKLNSAIYTTDIPDPIWSKRHGKIPTVCKHLAGIVPLVKRNGKTIHKNIILKYSKGRK